MAKKKNNTEDPIAPSPAPARRRAPAKKKAQANEKAPASTASAYGNGTLEPSRDEIAVAAYFRHLNRESGSGDEFNDWVEAERELKQRR